MPCVLGRQNSRILIRLGFATSVVNRVISGQNDRQRARNPHEHERTSKLHQRISKCSLRRPKCRLRRLKRRLRRLKRRLRRFKRRLRRLKRRLRRLKRRLRRFKRRLRRLKRRLRRLKRRIRRSVSRVSKFLGKFRFADCGLEDQLQIGKSAIYSHRLNARGKQPRRDQERKDPRWEVDGPMNEPFDRDADDLRQLQ